MSREGERLVVRNGEVLLPQGEWRRCDILLENGRIRELGASLRGTREVDASGARVLPGLVDLHVHGIGHEFFDADTLDEFARLEAAHGATTFFPTLFAPPRKSAEQMERHRRSSDELRRIPQVGGFRLESPYLQYTGAGVCDDLAPISPELTEMLLHAGGGHIRIWDISPELPGAPEAIRHLSRQGVVCSLAHTQASVEQARAAVDAGALLVTHLFDTFVFPDLTDPDPGVYPSGLTDYLLIEDRVVCEIIGDGTHVHPTLVEITLRCKGPDGVAFVTDGNFGAALPPGEYTLPNDWGRIRVGGPNDGVRLLDRGMELAGSALTPIDGFRNAVRLFGKDLATASRVCSTAPARLLGMNKGEIAVGRDADLILLEPDLSLRATIAAGAVVFDARA